MLIPCDDFKTLEITWHMVLSGAYEPPKAAHKLLVLLIDYTPVSLAHIADSLTIQRKSNSIVV